MAKSSQDKAAAGKAAADKAAADKAAELVKMKHMENGRVVDVHPSNVEDYEKNGGYRVVSV